jgi:hypothetical protein
LHFGLSSITFSGGMQKIYPVNCCTLRQLIIIVSLFIVCSTNAQTIGGSAVFNFLKLPASPQLTALGGVNVSQTGNDVGMAFYNPALLTPAMHTQMNAVFNSFYAGLSAYHLSMGYHHPKLNTSFAGGLHYINYGNIQQTDPSGNINGQFRPRDFVMQVSAARKYLTKWNYGTALKFISSNYGQYRSNGLAMDMGVLFHDTAKLFSASITAKNMGFQLKKYNSGSAEDLPFDLIIGITKRLDKAPLGFSVTAQHLHQFNIRYNDTLFNNDNGIDRNGNKKFTADKLFRHFVFATQIYLGDKVEVTVGYNHLRRQELNINNTSNGLNGFSMGAAMILNKLQIRFARAQYQNNTGYNQLGLNIKLNEYFGLGKFGERIGW